MLPHPPGLLLMSFPELETRLSVRLFFMIPVVFGAEFSCNMISCLESSKCWNKTCYEAVLNQIGLFESIHLQRLRFIFHTGD